MGEHETQAGIPGCTDDVEVRPAAGHAEDDPCTAFVHPLCQHLRQRTAHPDRTLFDERARDGHQPASPHMLPDESR